MELSEKPLKVEVSGGNRLSNTLVFGAIQTTLDGLGFESIEAVHQHGDGVGPVDLVPTMLDLLARVQPELFSKPVIVKQNLKNVPETTSRFDDLVDDLVYGWDHVRPNFDEIAKGDSSAKSVEGVVTATF